MSTTAERRSFDPERHDSQVVALFRDGEAARRAQAALIDAGVAPDSITVMSDGAALHAGQRHPVQDLFVPEDDYQDYFHALGRGHTLLIVRPGSAQARAAAVSALQGAAPLDLEQHGRNWRGTPDPTPQRTINHANVSRADMWGRAVGGRDEVVLDMTGQKMTVRRMSEDDMAQAPFARPLDPADRPAPLAPPPPARDAPVRGTSYTYGVPAEIVSRMSPEEQVMVQPHTVEGGERSAAGSFLRVVDGQTRVGWREHHQGSPLVRSYVTERPTSA